MKSWLVLGSSHSLLSPDRCPPEDLFLSLENRSSLPSEFKVFNVSTCSRGWPGRVCLEDCN